MKKVRRLSVNSWKQKLSKYLTMQGCVCVCVFVGEEKILFLSFWCSRLRAILKKTLNIYFDKDSAPVSELSGAWEIWKIGMEMSIGPQLVITW